MSMAFPSSVGSVQCPFHVFGPGVNAKLLPCHENSIREWLASATSGAARTCDVKLASVPYTAASAATSTRGDHVSCKFMAPASRRDVGLVVLVKFVLPQAGRIAAQPVALPVVSSAAVRNHHPLVPSCHTADAL